MSTTPPAPDTPEWHALRRTGLGGSDMAAALGFSRFTSPLDLWRQKCGDKPSSPASPEAQRGTELEGYVLDMTCAVAGVERGPGLAFVRHPRWDAGVKLLANLDGTVEPGGVLEAKTTRSVPVMASYRRGVPLLDHLLQVHHYAACTGRRWALIGCLLGEGAPEGCELIVIRLEIHPVLCGLLEELASDWWQRFIVADIPPPHPALHELALEIRSIANEVRCDMLEVPR